MLTTREAAAYCKLGLNFFRAAIRAGEVARLGGPKHPRFLVADLDAYLARTRTPAAWEQPTSARTPLLALPVGLNPLDGRPFGATATVPASPAGGRRRTSRSKNPRSAAN